MKKESFYKKCVRNDVNFSYVRNDVLVISDGANTYTEIVKSANGNVSIVNEELIQLGGDVEPIILPVIEGNPVTVNTKDLIRLHPVTGNDEYKPAMNVIHLSPITKVMEATDAHIALMLPYAGDVEILINVKSAMPFLKQAKKVAITQNEAGNTKFDFGDGYVFYNTALINVRYPVIKNVIPDTEGYKGYALPLKEMLKYKDLTAKPILKDGKWVQDSKSFDAGLVDIPNRDAEGIIMPIRHDEGLPCVDITTLKRLVGNNNFIIAFKEYEKAFKVWITFDKQKVNNTKATKPKADKPKEVKKSLQIEFRDYSERAFVLIGDTKPIKDMLKANGGRYNRFLKNPDGKRFASWIFSKKRKELIEKLVKEI